MPDRDKKTSFLNLESPFFRPLWRRVVTFGVCVIWALFEFITGSAFWGMLFLGLGLYAGWHFFFANKYHE